MTHFSARGKKAGQKEGETRESKHPLKVDIRYTDAGEQSAGN